jgi:GNAT superfamily N-acetyltransferase
MTSRATTSRATLTVGRDRYRVGPWHADPRIAYLALAPDTVRIHDHSLHVCVERLSAAGYSSVITSALHPDETGPFVRLGFEEFDRLRVLAIDPASSDAGRPNPPDGVRLRRARRRDRPAALRVDHRAFPEFWRLDAASMHDAETATPSARFRVAEAGGVVVAYAITGRSGSQAFLQRLATDPEHAGSGLATALCRDALRWADRHRCNRLLVNTQVDNERALRLYRHLGFRMTPSDLVVLARRIP